MIKKKVIILGAGGNANVIRSTINDINEDSDKIEFLGFLDDQNDVRKNQLIKGKITKKNGLEVTEEGCLSVPGYFDSVERADSICVSYLDRQGNKQEEEMGGLLAVCVQHEIDHLNGVLFIDHISRLKRDMIIRRVMKEMRQSSSKS